MASAFENFQRIFGFGQYNPQTIQAQRNMAQQKILELLGGRSVMGEQSGPMLPGVERPEIEVGRTGGIMPINQAEIVSQLMTTQGTEKVGNQLLEKLVLGTQMKPTSLQQNFAHLQALRKVDPGAATEFEKLLMKPQVQINQGAKILAENAKNWMNQQGKKASPTMTVEEATNAGFAPMTTDQQKSIKTGQEAAPLVASLTQIAFGDGKQKSLFPPATASLSQRLKGGLGSMSSNLTQSDERIVLYNRTKEAFVSSLARLSGQVGTLTDRDVGLVAGLFPTAGFTPEPIAKTQFKQIVKFLESKGVPQQELQRLGLPKWAFEARKAPPMPPGFVKEN